MATRLDIFRAQRRGFGTFLVNPEGTRPDIVGKTGYVESVGSRWKEDSEIYIGTYHVIYEGVNAVFLMSDEDGTFVPDPPMTFQRKVQLLNEEDRYVLENLAEETSLEEPNA